MNLLELRQALHAVLGFRSDIPTATPDQIIAAAKTISTRADDAEQELAEVHEALDEAGVPAKRPEPVVGAGLAIGAVDRVRLLVDEREEARDTIDAVHHALDDAKVRSVSDSGGLLAAERIRLLAEERTTLRAELDAYRSRGLPPAEAPKPAPEGVTLSAREVRALALLYRSDRDGDPRPAKQAIGVLLGVSDA